MQPLVLYDILSELPGNNWSPSPIKSRFVLCYKKIPFVTLWVEYADISIAMKSIGAMPIGRKDHQGADVYTIPVLSDPDTRAIITDSLEIASYLEKTSQEAHLPQQLRTLHMRIELHLCYPPSTCYQAFIRTHRRIIESRQWQVLDRSSFGICPAALVCGAR
ncbi:hypothetical protein CY34DRAFT_793462 [Suillus luteus UH-Slu-Lm8-n1]|uniref:GST N-terminal domain-containing protein n=1 Tax=Suillus luteus UH-Slu-Lm8-n1 TaxID=930992 RepID=A0A0D0AEV9_9AGAM|nr:hypothetical protein CY34DRAFT_793462 [Suillus luteus UH-Slu-Lm8-n1]